ncbi:mannan-binding lectin serine protease 2-like [Zerene cesonia]|uniref:mannan-binding lectin serine protease 2-like n=1 Tax=Zerene cesonia TaxID=33412 RepID=UPI0018E4F806|nr:mannan-binding lectin serine protease 2-like [Zerene cesonia]
MFYFQHCLLFSNLLSYLGLRPSCLCRCGIVNSGRYSLLDKIRGVDPIPPNPMPWLVFIHANDSIIPGTLISNRHVLTAASRVYALSPSMAFVQIGSNNFCNNNGLNYSVEAIRIPSGYTPSGGDSDLALLRLANEVSFNQYISPICLPLNCMYICLSLFLFVNCITYHSPRSYCPISHVSHLF